ncbi:MAG: ribosome biogenesis GTP-binding protein YihA/YsxC [Chitinophagaceae bacterium]|nr:ribosome biogenesis GTP-binding protein YihA/YsxC [Chitinophagaceae bacterium]
MVITSATYVVSSPDYKHCPKPDRPEYAFIGRSNVGKSSLINMLCNHQKLAKTSATPGKTQMINHFAIESASSAKDHDRWYIVDLPGYGFAKVSQQQRKQWEKMMEDYFRKRETLVNVFVLIDSRHSPQRADIEFVNRLGEWEIPFCIVFTKSDKTTQQDVSRNVKSFLNEMRKTWQFLPPHFITSTVKKTGRDKILAAIETWNKSFENRDKE